MYTDFNYKMDLQQMNVGTSSSVLPSPSTTSQVKNPERIHVQALTTNTGVIFIGESDVTSSGSTGGFELPAGANITLPLRDLRRWFAVSSLANQKLQIAFLGD